MHALLRCACAQADRALAQVLQGPPPVPARPSDRADLASAAPRALGADGAVLAARLNLSETWLEGVSARDGFLNFTLSGAWYEAAVGQPPELVSLPTLPPVQTGFPGRIDPFDWAFLCALKGRPPLPALAARQDAANPGALVRLTLRRLEQVQDRVPPEIAWTQQNRRFLLLLARFEPQARPKRQALYLQSVAEQVWELGPLRLSAPLLRFARGVLTQGSAAVLCAADGDGTGA